MKDPNKIELGAHDKDDIQTGFASGVVQKILVVDDELPMQILASTIIKRLGHAPVTVGSGEEAIETFTQHYEDGEPFAVIVMDLALPGGMSGIEATIAIKHIDSSVNVIVSSGYLEQKARGAALEHGFSGILPKPYTSERLACELRWVLKKKEAETSVLEGQTASVS